jgi:hypothetical protein
MSGYVWTVRITVDADVVADGFDIGAKARDFHGAGVPVTDGELLGEVGRIADQWEPHRFVVEVTEEPDPERILREQGCKTKRHDTWGKPCHRSRGHRNTAGGPFYGECNDKEAAS